MKGKKKEGEVRGGCIGCGLRDWPLPHFSCRLQSYHGFPQLAQVADNHAALVDWRVNLVVQRDKREHQARTDGRKVVCQDLGEGYDAVTCEFQQKRF